MHRLSLDEKIRAADEMGLSYGYYVALVYEPAQKGMVPPEQTPPKRKRPARRFTDAQAFSLWQARMTDAEIGFVLGVSRAYIQRWRDQLELPSTSKNKIDTKKYRLTYLQDGTPMVIHDDEL